MTGAGLIEVLISLLVMAVGLLGVLAVQMDGLRSNQRAEYLTEAHLLATDMMNIISAYDAFDDRASTRFINLDSASSFSVNNCNSGCSREQQYQFAGHQWSTQLKQILPFGRGIVQFDNNSQLFTIKVMWDEDGSGSVGENCSGNTDIDLSCYIMEVQI